MPSYEVGAPVEAGATGVSSTGDQSIDGLISGLRWSGTEITYSFPNAAADYDTDPWTAGVQYGFASEASNGFNTLNAYQQQAARAVFDMIEAITGLTFTEMSGAADADATIRFAESSAVSTAWAYLPSSSDTGGDVWFSATSAWYDTPQLGTYGFHTFMHEIGHALGLKHGHETGGNGALPSDEDSMEYSVMTYRSYEGASLGGYTNEAGGYAQTLMINDIAALQHMYGANFNHRSGDTTYSWDPATGEMSINGAGQGSPYSNRVFMSLWDGGGEDTYNLSAYSGGVVVDLRPGGESVFATGQLARLGSGQYAGANLYNALLYNGDSRSLIENARGGAGWDQIIGNGADNDLFGNGGRDTLIGLGGRDALFGGGGRDVLRGDSGGDTLRGGAHNDRLWGGAQNDRLFGDWGSDTLRGGAGRDIVNGGGGSDVLFGGGQGDTLIGGRGEDVMTGGAGADVFRFFAGDGADVVTDFTVGEDRIDFASFGIDFGQLTMVDEVGGVRVSIDGLEVFLTGLDAADLSASDFIF